MILIKYQYINYRLIIDKKENKKKIIFNIYIFKFLIEFLFF